MMSWTRRAIVTGALAVVCGGGLAWAADWPQWRGADREAVSPEKGLLQTWPEGGPALLWDLRGLGRGYSGVAIVGNRLYTMGDLQEANDNAQFVIAFDLEKKARLWAVRVGPPHGDGGPRCTPTVHDGLVYALGTDGDLVCVEAAAGREVWRKSFGKDFGGNMMSGWKYSESPLVDGDRLVVTPGAATPLAALDRKTGQTLWACKAPAGVDMGGAGYSSAVVSEGAGVRQYVTLMGKGALGVKADDGTFLWSYARAANGVANVATPVCQGDLVFVSSAYNTGSACLRLVKDGAGVKAEEAYWLGADTFQCHHGGFLRVGDVIYGAHGHNAGAPICIDFKTGTVKWTGKQGGQGSGAVVYADGRLYYRYQDDTVVLVEATPDAYKPVGSFKVPGRPGMGGPGWAHPVICDGKLYLRHSDVLFCYDIKAK